MAFRDRFEELFGEVDPYEPIDVGPFGTPKPKRSALPTSPDESVAPAGPLYTPDLSPIEGGGGDSGFGENVGRLLGAGAVQVGEMALGATEYVARQNTFLDGIVADTVYSGRSGLAGVREDIMAGINEQDLQKVSSEILTLDPDRTIWKGNPLDVAEAIIYKTAQALPATLVTMVPAVRWARAASPGTAMAYMGASEGVMSTGGIANAITDEIMGMDTETLMAESPRFKTLLEANGGNADVARNELIKEAQGAAPLVGGATVAAISAVAGRYFTPIFEKPGQALGSRVARGFAAEAPQEASQGGTEQLVQNFSARIYDLDRQLSEGVAEAAAQEGLIGGGMGAGAGGLFGSRPEAPTPPMATEEGGQGILPGMGPQEIMPDEMDQPSPEPTEDIQAQIDDLLSEGGPRTGVYIPPGQDTRTYAVPEGLVEMEDFDQQGGRLIVQNEDVALDARARIANGESRQEVIGSIVGAGAGKPTGPDTRVVQLLNEQGGVARESMVANQEEANALAAEWGPQAAILTPREAIERREALGAGPSADVQIQEDLFDNTAARGTEGVLVPPAPQEPGQPDLPLTVGREAGVGRVPLPAADDVGRPSTVPTQEYEDPAQEETPEATDPYEVSRRQDDMFAGEAPHEPTIEEEVRQDIRSGVPFEERAEPLAVVEGSRSFGQAADKLLGAAAETYEQEQRERIGGFQNPDRLQFNNPEYETAYRDAWATALDAELTIEMTNQKQAKDRAKKKRQTALQELGKIRQVDKPKAVKGRAESLVTAATAVNPAEVRETQRRAQQQLEPEPGPKAPQGTLSGKKTEKDYLGEFQASDRETIDSLADYTVRHKTPAAKEWTEEEFTSGPEAYARRDEIKKRYPKRSVTVDVKGTRALDEEFERAVSHREGRESKVPTKKTKSRGRDLIDEDEVEFKDWRDDPKPEEISGELSITENVNDEGEFVQPDTPETELSEVPTGAPTDYRGETKTPGGKLKFIRRESEARRRIDTGQKKVKASTVRVPRKKLRTEPLTVSTRKVDESVSDRLKREAAAKNSIAEVGKAATRASAVLRKLKKRKDIPDNIRADFLFARNYLDQLIQFARSIKAAKNDSTDATKLADGITSMLDAVHGLGDAAFAKQWGGLAKKNEFDSLAALDKTSLASMRIPKARAKSTARTLSRVRSRARQRAINEYLKGDQLYTNMIGPVLEKMTDYIVKNIDGIVTAPYIPTEAEIAEITYAMQTLKNNWSPARLSDMGQGMQREFGEFAVDKKMHVYTPVRKQMEFVGFQFDENGNVSGFEASDNYLGPQYNAKFGGTKAAPPSEANVAQQMEGGKRKAEAFATEDRTDSRKAAALYDKVNGLIENLQSATSTAKTTISGIKRQEARFIRGLKKLGVWRETGPGIGQININGYSTKTYRLVGPRLDAKTMLKPQARDTLQRMKSFPIPRAVKPFVNEVRTPEFKAGVEKFLDESATELFMDAAKPVQYDAEYVGVAEKLGQLMIEGKLTGQQVVDTILEIAPQNSFYRNLADRIGQHDVSGVEVTFGTEKDFPKGELGKFNRGRNRIILNREALEMGNLQGDQAYGARVVHTLTHELVHAVTHQQIDNTPRLRQYMETLQIRAREVWQQRVGGPLPYGLKILAKSQNQAHEFVSEAFSNHEFQNFLKDTPVEPEGGMSLWKSLVRAIRQTLGLPEQAPNNIFDAILLTEDILFDDAGIGGSVEGDLYLTGEGIIDNVTSQVQGLLQSKGGFWDRMKNAGRNLMTFEQLRDTYEKYFDGAPDGNPLTRYMEAWGQRNAAVSKFMKAPEKLSLRWTEMEANEPDMAQAISVLGTEASLHRITAGKKLDAKQRAELSDTRLAKYDELRAQFDALSPSAQSLYNDITSWYKDASADEAKLLLSASLRGVLTKGKNAPLTQEQFKARFTDGVIDRMKDNDSIKAELTDLFPEEEIDSLVKELARMSSLRTIGVGDYFPLMRYGEFVVYAETKHPDEVFADRGEAMAKRKALLEKDPTLDVHVFDKGKQTILRVIEKEFRMFESKTEAESERMLMDGKYDTVSPVQAKISRDTEETAISSNAALNTILTSLNGNPAAQSAIRDHYLRSLSDQSFRKHELKRKNRRGVDSTTQHRNLANYLKQSAHYRAQLKHGWKMGEALQDMVDFTRNRADTDGMTTEQLQQVVKQVQYRDQMTNDNAELKNAVRKGVEITQFMMLTSPSYWMINATQPWLVTAPIMGGKYGMGNSYAALKDAMSVTKGPLFKEAKNTWGGIKAFTDAPATEQAFNVVDQLLEHLKASTDPRSDDWVELIDHLRDNNIIDINVLTELRQIAEGVDQGKWSKTLDASRILAHLTEVSNRTVTAIAAYNLATNAGESKAAARKYAADMVSQTQFNYSSENKPPLFQPGGPLKWAAPLMFQFMQWPQHMYALLIRNFKGAMDAGLMTNSEARKSLLGLLGTHAAVGGVTGMALQPIKWALGMVMFAFGDDDEPYTFANAVNGRTFDHMVTETMTELFGQTAGTAVTKGLPTLLGADLSARMSMGTLYFVDLRGDTAESITGSLVGSFGGATLNQFMNWGNAAGKIMNGDVFRGIEQASPKIGRDFLRSIRYYNDGLVNNAGDTVIDAKDMSFGEVFLQGIGFAPNQVSQYYQGQAAIKGAQGYARDRRENLIRSFVEDGPQSETMREVMEFNRAYPSLRITRSTLIRGARAQVERESRYDRYGANIDEKETRDFGRYGEPYR